MKHSHTIRFMVIIWTLVVILAGAFVYGLIYLGESRARIENLRKEVSKVQGEASQVSAIQKAIDEYRSYLEAIDTHIVGKDGIIAFVGALESAAKEAKVILKIDSFTEGDAEKKGLTYIGRLQGTFTARGPWEDIVKFSSLIDSFPYQTYVVNVVYSTDRSTNEKKQVQWIGTWNLSVPKIKEAKTVAPLPKK